MRSARFIQFFSHLNFKTIRQVIAAVGQRRLPGLASEMAYNSMLALFPAILAMLTAIGLFQSLNETFLNLAGLLSEVAPVEALEIIQEFANAISTSRNEELFSLSFAIALWASSGALGAAMIAIDEIHEIPQKLRRPFWKAKIVSLVLTLGTIALLIIASTLIFIGDWTIRYLASQNDLVAPGVLTAWRLASWPLVLGIVSLAFGFVYRFGPSRWVKGKPLMPGAILAAVFWAILSGLFRYYVDHFGNYNRAYGAIGAVIVLMLWLYLSSLVMLVGEQINVTVGKAMIKADATRKRQKAHSMSSR